MKLLRALALSLIVCALAAAQTAALLPPPRFTQLDGNGYPLSGGLVFTYAAGTITPLASYTSSSGSVANTNPVVLDASGSASIWLTPNTAYKIAVQTSAGVPIFTTDNVTAYALPTAAAPLSATLVNYLGSFTGAVTRTAASKLADWTNVKDFGAIGDGLHDDTPNFQAALNSTFGVIWINPGIYKITSTLTSPWNHTLACTNENGGAGAQTPPDPFTCTLRHQFPGDFLVFNGSGGNDTRAGGLVGLVLEQNYTSGSGNSTGAGRALVINGFPSPFNPAWFKVRNTNIENTSAGDLWTWCIYLDGSAIGNPPNGEYDLRDNDFEHMRLVGGGSGGGAIYGLDIANTRFYDVAAEANSQIIITGTSNATPGQHSSSVYMIGCSGSDLHVDYLNGLYLVGGAWATFTSTVNSTNIVFQPSYLNAPAATFASGWLNTYVQAESRPVSRFPADNNMVFSRDVSAGDSTNQSSIGIGNEGITQGETNIFYSNAAAAASPFGGMTFAPRNTANTSDMAGGSIFFTKTAGADTSSLNLGASAGTCQSFNPDGSVSISCPIRSALFNSALPQLKLQADTTSHASALQLLNAASTTHYNWQIAQQANVSDAVEITPSTVVGGTTFTTPAFSITQAGVPTFAGTKSLSGTRYLCVNTAGVVSASATACSGT